MSFRSFLLAPLLLLQSPNKLRLHTRRLPPLPGKGPAPGLRRAEPPSEVGTVGLPGRFVFLLENLQPGPAEADVLDLIQMDALDHRRRLRVHRPPCTPLVH